MTSMLFYFNKNAVILHIHVYVYKETHTHTHLERLTCTVLVAVGWTILVCVGEASRTVWGACTTHTDTNTTHTAGEIPNFQEQMFENKITTTTTHYWRCNAKLWFSRNWCRLPLWWSSIMWKSISPWWRCWPGWRRRLWAWPASGRCWPPSGPAASWPAPGLERAGGPWPADPSPCGPEPYLGGQRSVSGSKKNLSKNLQ